MKKLYQEIFDEVHASGRLRTEVLNMREQERTSRRRRMPKAALIAAVLVLALAGTALAEGFGFIELQFVEDAVSGPAYHIRGDVGLVPLDSLPPELLGRTDLDESSTSVYPFETWSEAEEFLGLELADNARLEQMRPRRTGYKAYKQPEVFAPCLLEFNYSGTMPMSIFAQASYFEDSSGYMFSISAILYTEAFEADPRQDLDRAGFYVADREDTAVEEYLTPSGLEATIVTGSWKEWGVTYQSVGAYFVKNDAVFCVNTVVDDGLSDYERDLDGAIALMKEVLDAYQ